MEHRFLIIADDFTGANDTGVQLKRNGIPVKVVLNSDTAGEEHSIVIDTESRNIGGADAFTKVIRMLEQVDFDRFDFVVKRFFDGLPVVTKAGAFGKDDAIVYGMRKLKEKESRK